MPVQVSSITAVSSGYEVRIGDEWMSCTALVIATGGLAVPKIGATPFGYQVAEQFGLAIIPPKPALVPLAFEPESLAKFGDLSGISLDATVSCGDGEFREAVLLTHRGLSGPAILQISSYWQAGSAKDPIHVNVLPGAQLAALKDKRQSKAQLHNLLAEVLPRRFADSWCLAHQLTKPANELSDSAFNSALEQLRDWRIKPSGTLGYNKAEVTLGGVDTRTLSSKTMAVTNQPNLYFIGEVVDVTGHLGGFNFQWAWASGHAAGIAIAERRA
jgi:predicted Rossmann fold flavoprotein